MVFPVLNLPAVPLGQVLKGLTSSELFEMHQCSLKTGHTLRQFEKQNKTIKATVDFQRSFVDVRGVRKYQVCTPEESREALPEKSRVFDGQEVPTGEAGENTFNTFWPDGEKVEGAKKVTNELIRSLGLGQLDSVLISEENPAQEVLEWVQNSGVKMENFNLIGTAPEHRDALADLVYSEEFFRKVSMNYTSLLEVSPEFSTKNFKTDTHCITLFKLFLHHSHWFTIDHMMVFNTGAIILYHSKLSSADLNKYLTLWKEGNYTRVMYLSIHLAEGHTFDFRQITAGLIEPEKIRVEENNEVIELKRNDKIGELTLNPAKNELTFFVDDVPKAE
ncbi:unnamed protein product [Caenorhabditis brenneri]